MNLLLRPASWFSSAKHQGPIITQRRPLPATPNESDDDELVVVLAVQHSGGHPL